MKIFSSSILLILSFLAISSCQSKQAEDKATSVDPWQKAVEIEAKVRPLTFPDKKFDITDFGAIADGTTLNTIAINATIDKCAAEGGGYVIVPAGKFATGAIHLKSNVNLQIETGAELLFSTNPDDYLPVVHTTFEGTELMNYSPLIYAYNQKNIAITGGGTINGRADTTNWWIWKGSKKYGWSEGLPTQLAEGNLPKLLEMAEANVPVQERIFGKGTYMRPSFVQPFGCTDVLIQGITIIDAPFWVVHPVKCENVMVDGITINSHGPNNDGCDPEYSKDVVIKNSTFNTGDDCIAIKSGRNGDGRRVAIKSENILVKDCKMIDGHGGVVIGSEISAGVRNVFVENCVMDSPQLDRAIRIKTNTKRGGVVENVYVRKLEVGTVKEAVLKLNMFYAAYSNQEGDFMPVIRNINLKDVHVKDGGYYGILAKGRKESPISNVTLENVVIEKADKNHSLENVTGFKMIDTYINGQLIQSEEN